MNVLSTFDGQSCGMTALKKVGIPVDSYYASEIDKHAIQVSKNNWENIVQVGDVCSVKYKDGTLFASDGSEHKVNIDLLIGGSPCTTLSVAGNGSGFKGESGLFFEFVRLLEEVKPKYFFLENVKMKKEWEDVITETLNVSPITINSSLLSAQNRTRLYWTNIPNVEQPEDLGIVLNDILLPFVETKATPKRPATIKTNNGFSSLGLCHVADATDINGNQSIKRIYSPDGKSPTLTTMGGGHREPKVLLDNLSATSKNKSYTLTASYSGAVAWNSIERSQRTMVPVAEVSSQELLADPNTYQGVYYRKLVPLECERLQTIPSKIETFKIPLDFFKTKEDAKAFISDLTNFKPNLFKESFGIFDKQFNESFIKLLESDSTSFCLTLLENEIHPTQYFTTKTDLNSISLIDLTFNKLQKSSLLFLLANFILKQSNIELFKNKTLYVTIENGYTYGVSNSQRYKQIGNGWTVDVIAHIFSYLKNPKQIIKYNFKKGDVVTFNKDTYTLSCLYLNNTVKLQRFNKNNKLIEKVVNLSEIS